MNGKVQRTKPLLPPSPFQIYEDVEGVQSVLIRPKGPRMWLAMKLGYTPTLTFLSEMNLQHQHLIGRATLAA